MQSSNFRRETSYISLGERRGKLDLARFSLDLSWARAVSDSPHSRAYPSPPMSGSPPLPPRHHPDSSDRGYGGYGSSGQEAFRGLQTPQLEGQLEQRGQLQRSYPPDQNLSASYAPYRIEEAQLQFQQRSQMVPQQPQNVYQLSHPSQPATSFSPPDRPPTGESSEYSSPKQQRKTKGHVASACVPCKRAHLRCDAQRPCSRCLSNGKEDACVDVQHKKRGRPRLRDEREPRYEGLGPGYPVAAEASMRRPLSMYSTGDTPMSTGFGDPLPRSGSYRVLKSQGQVAGPLNPRFIEHASPADANVYSAPVPPALRMLSSQEQLCAYLTMEMQIAKSTQSFCETMGLQTLASRKLQDIVSPNELEKVARLQKSFEDERREKEPNYLPPIYLKFEEDRVIQSVGFGPGDLGQLRVDRQDTITFQGPDGQQRTFHVRLGLAKKDSTYFIVLVLNVPTAPQSFQQGVSSPYSRESHSRESQYGFQPPQQLFSQHHSTSQFPGNTVFGDPRNDMTTYRTPGPLGGNVPQSSNVQPFNPHIARADYSQGQPAYQTPRSEQLSGQLQRQNDLQLPPIRDQRGGVSSTDQHRRDDRPSRVDIGGLLERSDISRRGG